MLETYDNLRSDDGGVITGRTKLFIKKYSGDGEILLSEHGTKLTPEGAGIMFIVEDWLIPQLDKVQFKDGVLSVKDGEEIIPPVKTERELQREALLKQLAELDSQPTE